VTLFERRGDSLERRAKVIPAHFVKLYGDHGFPVGGELQPRPPSTLKLEGAVMLAIRLTSFFRIPSAG
jgi:hypothetical protein